MEISLPVIAAIVAFVVMIAMHFILDFLWQTSRSDDWRLVRDAQRAGNVSVARVISSNVRQAANGVEMEAEGGVSVSYVTDVDYAYSEYGREAIVSREYDEGEWDSGMVRRVWFDGHGGAVVEGDYLGGSGTRVLFDWVIPSVLAIGIALMACLVAV